MYRYVVRNIKKISYVTGALLFTLLIFFGILKNSENESLSHLFNNNHFVDIYPTYGYIEGDEWVVPLKLYAWEPRRYLEYPILTLSQRIRNFSDDEREFFRSRIRTFGADSKSRESIEFVFDRDPRNEIMTILDSEGNPIRTNTNGIIQGTLRISVERMEELLEAQDSEDHWLTFEIITGGFSGKGKIRLIGSDGVSVISDIDDTIKISEMPAGPRAAVINAFLKEYAAAPGMADLFQKWDGYPVHYVSGTPRQFYRPLSGFLFSEEVGFPRGTFHFRDVNKNLLSLQTWKQLEDMIMNENATYDHKMRHITNILRHFPDREFILVGDSGQHDPEIFRDIRNAFPGQVREIIIRDITNDRELNPQRLVEMTVIPATTVVRNASGLD